MRISYSWLCEYLEEKPEIEDLISSLKKLGFGVESVHKYGPDCDGVITAKVTKVEKHPNADRLSLCRVKTDVSEYDVICGAKNVKEGITVPFAPVGARLKNSILKKAKIRGIESNGMICSAAEIGLEEKSDGIMILDDAIEPGRDISEIFPKDYIIEIEITPNLAYCLSHYGLARELSIFCGYKLSEPALSEININNSYPFNIKIDSDGCLRYMGVVIKNIKKRQTPPFIMERLAKTGIKPKGNLLIDLSNYVMFELGQPTHFFDLRRIDSVVIRNAFAGEKIKTLDGNEYTLDTDITVIADSKKPIAVAGVIGGMDSSIYDDTQDILVEIANFDPKYIRVASKKLNIKTDSSYRFERGVDFNLVEKTAKRIVHLIKQIDPDSQIVYVSDVIRKKPVALSINIDHNFMEKIAGIEINRDLLNSLLSTMDSEFDGKVFRVPSFRSDITTLWDITEEYLRYVGYDKVVSKTSMPCIKSKDDPYLSLKKDISKRFLRFSFNECYTYDLVSEDDIRKMGYSTQSCIRIINPLSRDFEYLRPCGLASMLKILRYNLNRDVRSVKIYEFGCVFSKRFESYVDERRKLFILGCGFEEEFEWWNEKDKKIDFFYFKTVIDFLFGYEIKWEKFSSDIISYGAEIIYRGKKIGWAGCLKPSVSKSFDIKGFDVFYSEIDIEGLVPIQHLDFYQAVRKPVKPSQYQHGVRDLCVVIEKKYSFNDIYTEIKKIDDLTDMRLIDVYEDKKLGEGKRSLTFRFIFSSNEKTFTDEELNKKIEKIFNTLKEKFNVTLR